MTELMLSPQEIRDKMMSLEENMSKDPTATFGNAACPLEHTFVGGLYVREITMKAGLVITSRIHKTTSPYFIMSGAVSVITDDGPVYLKAPYHGITEAGTKRVLYIHEDTVWITVHRTDATEIEEVEDELVAKTFHDLPLEVKEKMGIKELT